MKVRIKTVSGGLPQYETEGSAGMDLRADCDAEILPGEWELIGTGLFIELPQGYEAQVRARSGLAVKRGINLINGVGTIDSDYRGEIKIGLLNNSKKTFQIQKGDRIAQMIVAKYERIDWEEVDEIDATDRGSGGFGHTGV